LRCRWQMKQRRSGCSGRRETKAFVPRISAGHRKRGFAFSLRRCGESERIATPVCALARNDRALLEMQRLLQSQRGIPFGLLLFSEQLVQLSKNLLQFRSMCTIIVMMIFRITYFWRIQDDRRQYKRDTGR